MPGPGLKSRINRRGSIRPTNWAVIKVAGPGLVRAKGVSVLVAPASGSMTPALPKAKVATPDVIGETASKLVSRSSSHGR